MSVVGAGGGNDTVLKSLYGYLSKSHDVTVFTNTKPLKEFDMKIKSALNFKLPAFGIFQQLMTINHIEMHSKDLLIFISGVRPITKVKTVYYHQQMPVHISQHGLPEKYKKGKWKLYYSIFKLASQLVSQRSNVTHYCVSNYLGMELAKIGINAKTVYPAVEWIAPALKDRNKVVTVCRISPEKNLEDNLSALTGFEYSIYGSTTIHTKDYANKLKSRLTEGQNIYENEARSEILSALASASIFYSSSRETLGLAVLESISAGCIPIVVDNSGNRDTVPFEELRFENTTDSRKMVERALNGEFDYLRPRLQAHLGKFTESNYEELLKA